MSKQIQILPKEDQQAIQKMALSIQNKLYGEKHLLHELLSNMYFYTIDKFIMYIIQKIDVKKYQTKEPTTEDFVDLLYTLKNGIRIKSSFVFNEGHAQLLRKILRLTLSYLSLKVTDQKMLQRIIGISRQAIKHMAYIEEMDLKSVPPEFQLDRLLPENFSIEDDTYGNIKSISVEDTKEVIIIPDPVSFYYWNHGIEKLKSIYTSLLNNVSEKGNEKTLRPLIQPNQYFLQSFSSYDIPIQKTPWLGTIRECFYMMYMINGASHYVSKDGKKERLEMVCFKLFSFPRATNPVKKSFLDSYKAFMPEMDKESLAQKKYGEIQNVLRPLSLLTKKH